MLQPAKSPWSASPACHNNPQNSETVNSKSTLEKTRLPRKVNAEQQQVKVNAARSMVNLWPRFLCQNVRTSKIKICQNSAPFDHALTKVNAGQTCSGNPSCNRNIFVLSRMWTENYLQGARTNQKRRENAWGWYEWNVLQRWLYLYQSLRVRDTFAGGVKP